VCCGLVAKLKAPRSYRSGLADLMGPQDPSYNPAQAPIYNSRKPSEHHDAR